MLQDAVRSLVKHGASVETMMSAAHNKLTPLMIAAQKGYFELAKILIEEMEAVIEKRGNEDNKPYPKLKWNTLNLLRFLLKRWKLSLRKEVMKTINSTPN